MQLTLKGQTVHSSGSLPGTYDPLPPFTLVNGKLQEVSPDDFKSPFLLLNIFPSLDTNTCASSVRTFNKEASQLKEVTVLCISADLPFAQSRFCLGESLHNVITLSAYRSSFPDDYGVKMVDGPLKSLCARAVVLADKERKILYTQLVSEITREPDYRAVLKILKEGN